MGLYEHKAAGIPVRQASCWLCQDTQLFAEKDPTLQDVALEEALLVLGTNSSAANSCGQHSFFLASLSNQTLNPEHLPQAAKLLIEAFGSVEEFKKKFKAAATGYFSSGRVWFGLRDDGGSGVAEKHDGSSLFSTRPDLVPLLVIDVWEHAYYLDYNDVRAAFVEGSQTAINWGLSNAGGKRRQEMEQPQPCLHVTTNEDVGISQGGARVAGLFRTVRYASLCSNSTRM